MPPRRSFFRRLIAPLVLAGSLLAGACIHRFVRVEPRTVERPVDTSIDTIRSPLKVHLVDGATVLFEGGARVTASRIEGSGLRYAMLASVGTGTSVVPMDSVVGIEAFSERTNAFATIVTSVGATAVGTVLAMGLAIAIFGSCPTVYATTPTGLALEAEGFSYALSPLMEHRDLDPLRLRADADGVLRLELRNEAMETHFINHVEIVAARHAAGTRVVSDEGGRPVTVGGFAPAVRARDRAGRDVSAVLAERDGATFSTSPSTTGAAREGDLDDWIDLDVSALPPGDSLAVVMRLRNSLLNTILLYEGMLGGRDGADLLTQDFERIAETVDLSRWYVRTMGMRATVDGVPLPANAPFVGHARLTDVGPIAFRDVAIVLPRPAATDGRVRIRLAFVADNWRIDEVRVAGTVGRPATTLLPVARVIVPTPAQGVGPVDDAAAVPAIAAADERYLETRPGQRMTLEFARDAVTVSPDASEVTYLLGWQGWYREWIRPAWLARPTRTEPFVAGDAAMVTAMRSWMSQRERFEEAFYSTSIPVR